MRTFFLKLEASPLPTLCSQKSFEDRGFHFEFGDILFKLNKNRFDENRWRESNPSGFRYILTLSLETNKQSGKTSLVDNHQLFYKGFLCDYGTLTLEVDINTFAQYLIAKPNLIEQYNNKTQGYFIRQRCSMNFYILWGILRQTIGMYAIYL